MQIYNKLINGTKRGAEFIFIKCIFANMKLVLLIIYCCFFSVSYSQLIDYKKINSFTINELNEKWKSASVPKIITPINYSIDIYDVLYYTEWHDGSMIKASGLYFVPNKTEASPLLVYNHGTRVDPKNRDIDCNREGLICAIFSTDGYAVIVPDYVGLGRGEKIHLYMHSESEANASVYFMKAIEAVNESLKFKLNKQLFLTGYSQGGHSTLALHQKIQEEYYVDYKVTASSPMSGPYDPLDVQEKVMFNHYTQPHYLPYLLISYNEVYNMLPKESFYDIFKHPYDSIILNCFSKEKSFTTHDPLEEINNLLPNIPANMIREDVVELYKTDYNFLKIFLQENSVYDWKPESPVQLCYCKSDEEVLYQNSLLAYNVMRKNGAKNITKQCVSRKYNHVECAGFSAIHTKYFFDSFRKGSVKGRKGPILKRMIIKLAKLFR